MTSIRTILGMGHKQPIPVDDFAAKEINNAAVINLASRFWIPERVVTEQQNNFGLHNNKILPNSHQYSKLAPLTIWKRLSIWLKSHGLSVKKFSASEEVSAQQKLFNEVFLQVFLQYQNRLTNVQQYSTAASTTVTSQMHWYLAQKCRSKQKQKQFYSH